MSEPFDDWPPAKQDNGRDWGQAKLAILELLWPMEWVKGSKIFETIGQTYYDRRVRELRESGWQIETRAAGKNSFYRLCSHEKSPGNIRQYPNAQQKRDVLQRDNNRCQLCGATDENMQFDHNIPLERHGITEVHNLQLLCRTCNIEKRGACKRCNVDSCEDCPYAYPERYHSRLTVSLDRDTAEQLRAEATRRGISHASIVAEILERYYEEEDDDDDDES